VTKSGIEGVTKANAGSSEKMGRPRLFDDDTERRMVMDAAVRVMARNGYAAMSVADILAEAGVSTSSFYRHFASKEVLLAELVRREAESARRYVQRATENAPENSALEAWLDAVLDLFFETKKAARTAIFSTPQVMSSPWMTSALLDMRSFPSEPLVEVLRAGHESKQLHSPTPEADAECIFGLLSSAATSPRAFPGDRAAVRAQVVRFAWPALSIAEPPSPGKRKPSRSRAAGSKSS
jgi:AcrR family transcriptional regulator